MNSYALFLLVLAALFLLDAVSTTYLLNRGYTEKNPLLSWAMKEIGRDEALALFKVVAFVAIASLAELHYSLQIFALSISCIVVAWNARLIVLYRRSH